MGSDEYLLIIVCCYEACCISLLFGCGRLRGPWRLWRLWLWRLRLWRLVSGLYGGFGPFLGYGGLFGGLPYFGFGGYGGKGGYGYGGKGGYGYGGSRYKRSTDSYTTAQPSPVTHYSPAVHAVHSSSHADTSPVHHAIHHASPVYHAVPASRTVHVSGHFSPAVVYSYPTPSYGHSYGHSTPIHSTVVHKNESPYGSVTYGHNTPSYGYATPPSQGHSPSYSYTSY